MSRIDERLEIMGVDTSNMTAEEKFTAATGLTRYDAEMAANDWYVPAGAANTLSEPSESTGEPSGEQGQTSEQGQPTGVTPTGEPETTGESGEPTGEQEQTSEQGEPTGVTPTGEPETTGESGEPSTVDVDTNKFWYIGTTQPTNETVIANNIVTNNESVFDENDQLLDLGHGWRIIPEGTYDATNPVWKPASGEGIYINENFDDEDYYLALPQNYDVHATGGFPHTELGTIELNGVTYKVWKSNGSVFAFEIY